MSIPKKYRTCAWGLLALSILPAAWGRDQPDTSDLITVRRGDLPLVLSAPHGGRRPIPGVLERKGEGAIRFVTVRDENTAELTELLSKELQRRLHGKPFIVIAHFERKHLDVNRADKDAFESEQAGRY